MTMFDCAAALKGDMGDWARNRVQEAKDIATLLDSIAKGILWMNDEEDGPSDWVVIDDEKTPTGDLCQVSMYDYLNDNFGVWCTVDNDGEVTGARILIAYGGPNTYIDTNNQAVEIEWNGHFEFPLSEDAIEALDDYGQQYFEYILDKKMNERMGRTGRW